MHVRERHENMQRKVTFYRYVLEYGNVTLDTINVLAFKGLT
jgi:hypothetical protein